MPVAIVTGASSGFGNALAVSLAEDEFDLVIDARHRARLDATLAVLANTGARVRALVGDVSDPMHRSALVGAAEEFGSLDLLVNNASELGASPLPSIEDVELDDVRRVFEVNVFAPLALDQLALPFLRKAHGAIVAISSDAAIEPYPNWGSYGSSKAALDQLHRVLACEENDVRVYSFDPGDMLTPMHQLAFPDEDVSDRPTPWSVVPALRRLLVSAPPSGRYRVADWRQS